MNGSDFATFLPRNSCLGFDSHPPSPGLVGHVLSLWVFVSGFNLLTNGFAYLIFLRYTNRSVLITLLLALSLAELAYNLIFLLNALNELLTVHNALTFPALSSALAYSTFIVYIIPVALTGCHLLRNWLVVLISAYRFEVVCRALSPRCRLFTSARATVYMVVVTAAASLVCCLPRVVERRPLLCQLDDDRVAVAGFADQLARPEMRLYVKVYYGALLFALQSGGPTIVVFVLSSAILARLAKRQRDKRSLQGRGAATQLPLVEKDGVRPTQTAAQQRRRREKDGGRLVIVLCVCFFTFEMPTFVSKLGHHLFDSRASMYIAIAANFSTLFDSASNFFVYLASNRSFRQNALSFLLCERTGVRRGGLGAPSVRTVMS